MAEVRRQVEATARLLQDVEHAPALRLLEYSEGLTRLSAARMWKVREELEALEALLDTGARTLPVPARAAQVPPALEALARGLRLPRLGGVLQPAHLEALLVRARGERGRGAPTRGALDALEAARLLQTQGEEQLGAVRALAREGLQAFSATTTTTTAAGPEREARARLADLREHVHAERELAERLLEALQAEARALAAHLAELSAPLPTTGFAALRGALPPPVDAPVAHAFGTRADPTGTTATLHRGMRFLAPRGTPVRAVAPATVVHAGWVRGHGRVLVLDHGEGFHTLLAHLDAFGCEVGQRVAAGQQVGTVGDSGSLEGAALYFELRQGGLARDPVDWLLLPEAPAAAPVRTVARTTPRASGRPAPPPARPARPAPPPVRRPPGS
jgi:murein DD-endopeptidase MepM/ murein hydrolase activator NlpD